MRRLLAILGLDRDGERPSLIDDMRTGRAGLVPRLVLSVVFAGVLAAVPMLIFGLIEQTDRYVRDSHVAVGLCITGAVWCASMILVWATYRRGQRIIRTVFLIVGIWIIAIPAGVVIDEATNRAEFFIAALLLLATALSILLILTALYRSRGGKALKAADGTVIVNCAQCGYSLIGLEACRCPECGWSFTLDELIDSQDYSALRDSRFPIGRSSQTGSGGAEDRSITAPVGGGAF